MTKEDTHPFHTLVIYEPAERGEFRSIYGDKLTKIYKFKKDDPNLFESDVPETTRALVDLYSDSDESSRRSRCSYLRY